MLIVRDLYGIKSSGTEFRDSPAETLDTIGYRP